MTARLVSPELVGLLRHRFALRWKGIHGAAHWARVRWNGRALAERTGANRTVVELFALVHDVCRQNDHHDPQHGARAAEFVHQLRGSVIWISDAEAALLAYACTHHSDGYTEADVTIQTCWDADRLDLGRVGIRPQPRYLCTPAAKDPRLLEFAYERSARARRWGRRGVLTP
jgi:uncharacterized protein